MTDSLKTGLIVGLAVLVATGAVFLLVVVPNSVESAIAVRDTQWRDSLAQAPVVLRDTVKVTEDGRTITVSRHDTVFIRETTPAQFYHESAETLASDNASVSFTLRETVNRETGEFAHSYEGIQFRYPRITNTVAVNAPPVAERFYQGAFAEIGIGSQWKRLAPSMQFAVLLRFKISEVELEPTLYAQFYEYQIPDYGWRVTGRIPL